jgi:hypothetical protein
MFTLFFSHLTTSITEVDIFLSAHKTARDRVMDLVGFKTFYDKAQLSMTTATKERKKKKPEDTEKHDEGDAAYQNDLAGYIVSVPSRQMHDPENIIKSLGWNIPRYVHEWGSNYKIMGFKPFNRDYRVANRRGERMLVMSGLDWNLDTRNAKRDWPNTASAITVETALVESYREDLLLECPGASALREEIRAHFVKIAHPHNINHPSTGLVDQVYLWEFPDGFATPVGIRSDRVYVPEVMRDDLNRHKPQPKSKDKKRDAIQVTITSLVKNKYLTSSHSTASSGVLETLAYQCIKSLAHVSEQYVSRATVQDSPRLWQIMYFNRARLAHPKTKEAKNGSIFDGKNVMIPDFERLPHLKTGEYAKYVSRALVFPRRAADVPSAGIRRNDRVEQCRGGCAGSIFGT